MWRDGILNPRFAIIFIFGRSNRAQNTPSQAKEWVQNHFAVSKKQKERLLPLFLFFGAGDGIRTHDLLITNQLRYRLRYSSKMITHFFHHLIIISQIKKKSNTFLKEILYFFGVYLKRGKRRIGYAVLVNYLIAISISLTR